jgi:carnitine 3-dehydrogenase / betainyl-CoA thioesterase
VDEAGGARPRAVGLLGGGVIGGGWAARFLQNGVDVRVYDPAPDAAEKIAAVVANARRAWSRLTLAPLPQPGRLEIVASVEEAVAGVGFVQENAPEREPLKRELFARADRAAEPGAIFLSSTSGLRPSLLQSDMDRPGRLAVGHPFNPVYLLPLVEVCGGERTDPETLERAAAVYRSIGMEPLVLRTEIDGFVADRLMEAMWREALWLVADDVATVTEIDDAIRLGAGLRWAIMGSFLTYRAAGGDAGMRHFLAQFGPALEWPWTKLTDVPELTDELLEKLVAQSDAQAEGRSVRELEQVRDDCLVAILAGLRGQGYGAGAVLERYERELHAAAGGAEVPADRSRPLELHAVTIPPEWVDYNGHTHESRYLQVFGDTTDALLRLIGVDAAYLAETGSYFTVETHLSHLRETSAGDRLAATTQVLGADDKRLHIFHTLRRGDGEVVASAEQMMLHVSAATGRAGPAGDAVLARVRDLAAAQAPLPRPERAGRSVGLR